VHGGEGGIRSRLIQNTLFSELSLSQTLVEAGQTAARYDAELGRFYRRLAVRKHRALAKVAVARKLAVRLYLMLREDWTYAQLCRAVVQASPSHAVVGGQNRPLE